MELAGESIFRSEMDQSGHGLAPVSSYDSKGMSKLQELGEARELEWNGIKR